MSFEQIVELVNLVADRRLAGVEIERSGFRLVVSGAGAPAPAPSESAPPTAVEASDVAAGSEAGVAEAQPEPEPEASGHVLKSPIVGTFYAAPSPDADPFVRVGDRVQKGQVVCIVEAMKLMNEIEADVDGVVTQVLPKNAQPVEYGEGLFVIDLEA